MRFIALVLILLSFNALADTTYVGKQPRRNTDCFLHIKNTYYVGEVETAANFRADVLIEFRDFAHGGGRSEELDFTVSATNSNDLLSGLGENGKDTINLFITPGSIGLSSPTKYAARFLHGSHFDSVQCLNLVIR